MFQRKLILVCSISSLIQTRSCYNFIHILTFRQFSTHCRLLMQMYLVNSSNEIREVGYLIHFSTKYSAKV